MQNGSGGYSPIEIPPTNDWLGPVPARRSHISIEGNSRERYDVKAFDRSSEYSIFMRAPLQIAELSGAVAQLIPKSGMGDRD